MASGSSPYHSSLDNGGRIYGMYFSSPIIRTYSGKSHHKINLEFQSDNYIVLECG